MIYDSRFTIRDDETLYWFEALAEAGLVPQARVASLAVEADAILAMTVASIKTLRSRSSNVTRAIVNPKS